MDKEFSVKPGQKFGTSHRSHLGLILLLCLSLCSETVNAHPQATDLNPSHQLIAQTDTRTQAQQLFDQGKQLYRQKTAESYRQAITKWEAALPLWRELEDKSQEALTLVWIGFVYQNLGFTQKALEYYNSALSIYQAISDRQWEAVILNNIGAVYSDLGEKQQALDYYQQALPLRRKVGDRQGEATTLHNIGKVYSDLGEKQQALEYYQQALPLSKTVGDRKEEAVTLSNIGKVYSDLGEKQQALEYYQQALPLSKAVGDRKGEAVTLNNIGKVYSDLGEKQQALDYYQQALPLRRKVGDRKGEATTLDNIGKVYSDLGEKQQALDYFQQALPLRRKVGDRKGEATTLHNIGAVYSDLGKKQQALEHYQQALPLGRKVRDRKQEARTLNNIGAVYSDLGEKQQALESYQQALPLSKAVGDRTQEAVTLNNIGGVYFNLGKKQQALDYYQQALPLSRAVGNRQGEAVTLYNMAYLERSRGNLQAALTRIKASIKIREYLRTEASVSPELRQTYFSTQQGRYQFYISLLMELHQQNPFQGYDQQAFNISERSRARTLLELLTEANAKIQEGVDPQLLAEEKRLQGQLDATEKQRLDIYNNPNSTPKQKTAIDQQHQTLLKEYEDLKNEIRTKSPKYADLKDPKPLTLEQVQEDILDQDTVLLQYSLGEEKSYLWVVTKEEMSSYELPSQKDIEKRAKNLIKFTTQGNPKAFTQAITPLSKAILHPVKDKLTKKRIVVVADGVLQYIPFAALSVSENQQPLITNYDIINLPSSSSLAIIRHQTKARKPAPKTLAVLADPVFSINDQRINNTQDETPGIISFITQRLQLLLGRLFGLKSVTVNNSKTPVSQPQPSDLGSLALKRSVRSLRDGQFDPLPGTRQEGKAILKLIRNKTQKTSAFDFNANLTAATNPELSQYRIVHFATHGILNTESPELSGLVLSLVDETGNNINGFLRLHEIFNLKLPAEIVVLSACQTGVAKDIKGEGLVGLTRGFMYAGSPRVLVSLWKVDDQATAEIMTRFYRLMLKKKLSPAEALRKAQLEMQEKTKWKSPYYWAAFVLQGEWN
ncbi:MAG: tetratricopeptide repeat protein [Moorea sp. SIO3G5]|nr:tetratricopeptide repeat protein [Moorena sp. SIO3G5]